LLPIGERQAILEVTCQKNVIPILMSLKDGLNTDLNNQLEKK
jgi:hypothetical protein